MNSLDIFLSHSSADERIALALINLLRDALSIEREKIRCSSVPGYKLKTGAHTETELRQEIQQARVFIGLLSEVSLGSAYVLFEPGARWGAMQNYGYNVSGSINKLFPLLAAGATASMIRDPLKAYNALNCEKSTDLHQLISDVGQEIGRQAERPDAHQDKMDALIRVSRYVKGARKKAKSKVAETPKPSRRKANNNSLGANRAKAPSSGKRRASRR